MNENTYNNNVLEKDFEKLSTLYDRDELRFFVDSSKQMVKEINFANVSNVLDLATGTGNVILEIIDKKPECCITGIDISDSMLLKAKEKLRDKQNVTLKRQDMESLKSIENSYDLVTCAFGTYFVNKLDWFF